MSRSFIVLFFGETFNLNRIIKDFGNEKFILK